MKLLTTVTTLKVNTIQDGRQSQMTKNTTKKAIIKSKLTDIRLEFGVLITESHSYQILV